ncbi:MAG TPA: methyltransferase domain-containing protein [Verrucomicrobiae bacterium]|nr:methyltransferase domain-containing protein [Verrucomicrobiae bacterium]
MVLDKDNRWDAETYHKISNIQEEWAIEILDKRKIKEDEVILDAGCGSGRVTQLIAKKVKIGKIYAVDIDANMISNAKINLKDFTNVIFIQSDLINLKLPEKVDLIFSNAVIHWIFDHERLFKKFWDILKSGGELLIQFGGKDNLGTIPNIADKIIKNKGFSQYFENWKMPWNFNSVENISKILKDIGFKNIDVNSEKKIAKFTNLEEYRLFMKTVVLKPYLSYLPTDNNNKKEIFIDEFIKAQNYDQDQRIKQNLKLEIDYTRLNIFAKKYKK